MSMGDSDFFSASQVIDKDEFLRLYRTVNAVSNLLLAPFGFSDQFHQVVDEDRIIDEFTPVFQQIEDVVAKFVFRHFGYDDDRIIASMHQYIGIEQDKQLMQEIKSARQILVSMIDRPAVVDFDFPQLEGEDYKFALLNDTVAKELFEKVHSTLQSVAAFTYLDVNQNDAPQKFTIGLERDAILHRAYGINVLKRMPSPILCLSNLLDIKNSEKVKSIVESILNTFILPNTKNPEANLSLSQEQIHVLLDIYWNPSEINNGVSLEEIRMGFGLTDVQAFRHPLGQFILQLSSVMIESNDSEEGDDSDSLPGVTEKPRLSKHRYRDATESLAFVAEALKKLEEAKNVMSMGDAESAAETLGEGCLDLLDFDLDMNAVLAKEEAMDDIELVPTDSDEEGQHTPKGTHIIIPIALQVELLLARAKYLLESGQLEAALVDIQRAIDCDCSSSAAYALRAQVRLALIQRGQVNFPTEADEEEEEEGADNVNGIPAVLLEMVDGDASLISDQDVALHKAAADAMVGFLLSGSSDVSQASLAEELAKEAVRSFSRNVFHNRRLKLQEERAKQSAESNSEKKTTAPKPWLIGSYLSSYPLLSKSLHLAGARTAAETLRRDHWQKTQENDIDESDYKQEHQTEIMWEHLPPDHLLDTVEGEAVPVVRDQDVAAYDLLVQMCDSLESLAFGDAAQPLPAHLTEKTKNSDELNDVGEEKEEESQVDFTRNAKEIAVKRVSDASELAEDKCFVARTVEGQSVLALSPLSATVPNNWRIVHLGRCSFSPLSEADFVTQTEHETKQDLEEDNALFQETTAKAHEIMVAARKAATLAGVKLEEDSFTVKGFDFELKPLTKASESSSSSSYNNKNTFDSFSASQHAHDYFFNQHNGYSDDYGRHFGEDEDEEGEDEWEDCDDEEDEDEEPQTEKTDNNKRNESLVEEKESKKVQESVSKTQCDEQEEEEDKDEDFDRLASMVERVDLSRGGSLTSATVSELEEAFQKQEEKETNEIQPSVKNNDKVETLESEGKSEPPVNTEDVDVSIDELIDALEPLATETQEDTASSTEDKKVKTEKKQVSKEPSSIVSNALRARLLNLVASLAYLVGDSVGASQCFQASLQFDATLHDSRVKLGALYVDLDEPQKAYDLLSESLSSSSGDAVSSSVSLLHLGQWALNESDFSQAADFLRRANRLLQMSVTHNNSSYEGLVGGVACPAATEHVAHWVESVPWQERCDLRQRHAQTQVHSNVYTLLAVATFRQSPTDPEFAVSVMKEGLNRYPSASSLMLCGGEILSQAGDMVKGLEHFRNVSQLPAYRALPLPYVSAARVYQQLGQLHKAHVHLSRAIQLDDTLAMTLVDLSQLHRQEKQLDKAVQTIDQAMRCAKQVSEIRDVLSTKYLARLQQTLAEKYHLDMSVLNNNTNANQ